MTHQARAQLPSRPTEKNHSYIPSLDGLRGLAIAGVLLFHTGRLSGGFLGVDLFFVLSGFLITGLLLREITTNGSLSLARFWARRLRRLFPALAAMLAVTTLATWWLQHSTAVRTASAELVRTTLSDGLWVQLHLVNWHLLAQDASYWETFGQSRLFAHLWSIAVEEQFYILWPLLLMVLAASLSTVLGPRYRGNAMSLGGAVIILCAALAATSQLLMVLLLDSTDPTRVYTGTDTRAFSLLLGASAATEPARRLFAALLRRLGRAAGAVMLLLGAGLLSSWLLVTGTDSPGLFTGGLFAHAAASALLIGLCAEHHRSGGRHGVLRAVLEFPGLTWLGRISYSLYLWHWPVIVLMEPGGMALFGEWTHTLLVIVVSLTLAAGSTHLIENPVRFRAGWARGWRGAAVLVLVSAGLLCLWLLLPAPEGQQIDVDLL